MDIRNREDDTRWVEERLASLDPPSGWRPDTERALDRLNGRQNAQKASRWMRLSMASAVVVGAAVVLTALPWRAFWSSEAKPVPQAEQVEHPDPQLAPFDDVVHIRKSSDGEYRILIPAAAPPLAPPPPPALVPAFQPPQAAPPAAQSEVTQPVPVHRVLPEYTDEARKNRIIGTVELVCTVLENGKARFERVAKSLGYGLDESAQAALEQWLFTPAMKDGRPVAVMTTIQFHFGLK